MPHVVQVSVDGVDATLLRRTSTRGLLSGMVFAVAHAGDRSATVPLRATPFGVFVPARTAGLRTISTGVGIVDGGLGGETRDGRPEGVFMLGRGVESDSQARRLAVCSLRPRGQRSSARPSCASRWLMRASDTARSSS